MATAGMTWLHLSDWHQKGMDFDRKVVRDALEQKKDSQENSLKTATKTRRYEGTPRV
jgi:hypothetical protein